VTQPAPFHICDTHAAGKQSFEWRATAAVARGPAGGVVPRWDWHCARRCLAAVLLLRLLLLLLMLPLLWLPLGDWPLLQLLRMRSAPCAGCRRRVLRSGVRHARALGDGGAQRGVNEKHAGSAPR
jgi:hypothetical protein